MKRKTLMTAFYQLSSWMSSLPERERKKSLFDLILPGSHDSAGCTAMINKLTEEWNKQVAGKRRHLPHVKRSLERWTHTQSLTVDEQLEMGIRHFDFRLSCKPNKSVFYFSHGPICSAALFTVYSIYNFLQMHRGEAVVVSIRPDIWHQDNLSEERVDQFLASIHEMCKNMLIPKGDEEKSLNQLGKSGHRLMLNYYGQCSSQAWLHQKQATDDSASDYSLNSRMAKVKQQFEKSGNKNWVVLSFPVDPTLDQLHDEIYKLSSFGLKDLSEELHKKMYDFLDLKRNLLKQRLNVVETDFVDEMFVRTIVELNYE